MRRALVGLLLHAVACTPTSRPRPDVTPAPVAADTPAITATLLGTGIGKPPLRFYNIRLTLVNRHERPIWMVFPYYADDAFPAAPVFVATTSPRSPFGGRGYDGVGGRVVEVEMYGDPGFRAFHLPPRGRVVLDSYSYDAWKPVEGVEVWEVAALKVDGGLSLERWLPDTTLSAPDVRVPEDTNWTHLDWDGERSRSRDDHRDEPVGFVTAEVLRRSQIAFRDETTP